MTVRLAKLMAAALLAGHFWLSISSASFRYQSATPAQDFPDF
jgi:hypothetical protein